MRLTGMLVLVVMVVAGLGMALRTDGSPSNSVTAVRVASPAAEMQKSANTATAQRQTKAAQRQRVASRAVHRDLSGSAVRRLVAADYADLVRAPAGTDERLKAAGARLEKFQAPDRAVVTIGSRRAVAVSTSPLAVAGRSVDPALERSGVRFEPRQAVTEYAVPAVLPADGRDVVSFERSGATVGFSVPGGKASEAVEVDGGLVFANAARDLDVLVRPISEGAELSALLRSPSAPRTVRMRVDGRPGDDLVSSLPDSTGVRQGPPGGALLLRDGHPVVAISPATALDAQGQVIKVDVTIDGLDLVYTVDVPQDVAWPIAVDPYVSEDQRYWSTNATINFAGWTAGYSGGTFGTFAGSSGFGRGLYLFSNPNQAYASGAYAAWRYQAPFVTGFTAEAAKIFKADFSFATHTLSNRGSCIGEGIFNNGQFRFEPSGRYRGAQVTDAYTLYASPYTFGYLNCAAQTNGYTVHCLAVCDVNGGPDTGGSAANSVSLHLYQGAGTPTTGAIVYLQGSLIFMSEQSGPHATIASTAPAAWTKDPFTINATVNDYGLGPKQAAFTAPGATGLPTATQGAPCTGTPPNGGGTPGSQNQGDRDHRCTAPLSLTVGSAALPEGSYAVTVTGTDILGNNMQAPNTTPVKIDRTAPSIAVTLPHAPSAFVKPGDTVQIRATDPASGVGSLTYTIDAGVPSPPVTCTTDGCPLSTDYVVSPDLVDGPHILTVTAADRAGNLTASQTPFTVDATAPSSSPNGIVAAQGADDGRVPLTGNSYRLVADARDNAPTDEEVGDAGEVLDPGVPGAGVESMTLQIDGQTKATTTPTPICPSDPACEKSIAYNWDTTNVSNGPHEFRVIATDKVGNVDANSWAVTIAHQVAQPARANTLKRTIAGAPNMRAGTSVAAVGDINADGRADYLVGAPGEQIGGKAAGAAYLVLGSASETMTSLATSSASVLKFSGPSDVAAGPAYCGTAVASAGDVNGDEIGDFLIGCPGLDTSDILLAGLTATTGKVYVVFGSSTPQSINLSNLGTQGFVINGPTETAGLGIKLVSFRPAVFGERLSSAPTYGGEANGTQDVNGDGLNDIVVGDSKATSAYVIFGRAETTPLSANNLGAAGYAITGTTGLTGYSTAIVDDLTNDGLAETLVGDPGSTSALIPGLGAAYIVPGSATRTGSVSLTAPDQGIVKLTTGVAGDRLGAGVAGLGDTDLDGRADFAISTTSGALVVRSAPTASKTVSAADGFAITSTAVNTGGLLGTGIPETPIAAAGDIDGDERQDLVAGYPDAGTNRAYTILSPEGSPTVVVSASLQGQYGSSTSVGTTGDRSGTAVGANGFRGASPVSENAQAILGAPLTNPNLPIVSAGAAYVVSERVPTGPATTLDANTTPPLGSMPAATRAAQTPGRYFLSDDWASIRNKYAQFFMGSAAGGSVFDAYKEEHKWLRGKSYYPTVRRCGWVDTKHIVGDAASYVPGQCPGPEYVPPKYFSRLFNCDYCADGTFERVKNAPAGSGGWPIYRNVHPGTTEHKHDFAGRLRDNANINWRYISKSGKYVLVRLTDDDVTASYALGALKWGFVPRAALPPAFGPGGLCNANRGIEATGIVDGKKPRMGRFVDDNTGPNRVPLWPPVCSRQAIQK